MVIVRLIGGLGNQMFQYALGRALALRHGVPVKLDIGGFEQYKVHGYCLNRLRIVEQYARPDEVRAIKLPGALPRILNRLFGLAPNGWVREAAFHFDPTVMVLRPPLYLEGYWQSEKYFAAVRDVIRGEFTIRDSLNSQNRAVEERISNCNSVALHVRRGDYVSNPRTNAVHGVCGVEYYQRAAQLIGERIPRPEFFIFSDDPEWAKANLRLSFPSTVVNLNDASRSHWDLHLMSRCRHQIIANSSFSWWAAWLNGEASKIVIAPRRWFKQSDANTADLIPAGWLRV